MYIGTSIGINVNQFKLQRVPVYNNPFIARENMLMCRKIPSRPGHHASKTLSHLKHQFSMLKILNVENQQRSVDKALEALKLFVGNVEEKSQQKIDDLEKRLLI